MTFRYVDQVARVRRWGGRGVLGMGGRECRVSKVGAAAAVLLPAAAVDEEGKGRCSEEGEEDEWRWYMLL